MKVYKNENTIELLDVQKCGDDTKRENWLLCPICKNKTRIKIRCDTVLENFPLFCPKCRQEQLITVNQLRMCIITEADKKMQSG